MQHSEMQLPRSRRAWLRSGLGSFAAVMLGAQARATNGAAGLVAATEGGRLLQFFDARDLQSRGAEALTRSVRSLVPLGAGSRLAGCGVDGALLLIDSALRRVVAETSLGGGAVHAAASSDGRWLLAWAAGTSTLALFDAALRPVRSWQLPGPLAWLADAAHRRSFVLALADRGMVWEISYNERAEDFYEGLVHDFRMGEGVPQRGFHNARRMPLPEPLLDGSFDRETTEIAGGGQVFNLDVRRVVARHPALQAVAPGAGFVFERRGRSVMGLPAGAARRVDWFSTGDWAHLGSLALSGPARFVRGHARWPVVLVDAGETLLVVDRERLQPLTGLTLAAPCVAPVLVAADGSRLWALSGAGRLQAFDASDWQPREARDLRAPVAFASTGA